MKNLLNGADLKTEILAGITTFFTMSYILFVNPAILSKSGMPKDGVFFATAFASGVAILIMGYFAELPFALAPGMGLNAYFAYTVCLQKHISWETALTAVFIEGVVFLIMALFSVRESIFRSVPKSLAYSISAGIGLFIALIGFHNSGIITYDKNTLLKIGKINSFEGIVTVISLLLIAYLIYKGVSGSLLIGIVFATVLALIFGKTKYTGALFGMPHPTTAFKLDFHSIFSFGIVPIVITFLLVDIFDTVGTLAGLCARLGIPLDDKKVSRALTTDAVGTTIGGLLGTSTITTYIESASGVAAGGKTGVTAIVTAILFFLSIFLAPLVGIVPTFATSAVLIYVGVFMMGAIKNIDWENPLDALPAFVVLAGIPFTFSISDGMGLGFITYVFVRIFTGKFKELNWILILITLVFILKFFW